MSRVTAASLKPNKSRGIYLREIITHAAKPRADLFTHRTKVFRHLQSVVD